MNFTQHYELQGKHAFLSPSQSAWLNYDDEKLRATFRNRQAMEYGTRLHALAAELIDLGIKLPRTTKTLNSFVNDAIGYRMQSEVILYFSEHCFGTADTISFSKNLLRIGDLKTGVTPVKMTQLVIYAALFCLEYNHNPEDLVIELRIYQYDEILLHVPDGHEVRAVMNEIMEKDKILSMMEKGAF